MRKLMRWNGVTDVILILLAVLFFVEGFYKIYQGGENIAFYFIFGVCLALIPAGKRRMDKKQREVMEQKEPKND